MPGSTVTIVRSSPTGMITVSGVRLVRKPAAATPSRSISRRTYSPPRSSPTGATSAVSSPSRAAATAVIAPPPGERTSSPAKRSSPGAGSDSSPTNDMSRKAGVATASSTRSTGRETLPIQRGAGLGIEAPQAVADEAVADRVADLRGGPALDLEDQPVDAHERLAPQRLDVLDLALEGAHHPVLPQPRKLRPHADDRVGGLEPQPLGRREAHARRADEARHERVDRLLVELRGRADLLEPALVHHRDAVTHRHRLDLVVGDVDRGRADLLLQLLDLAARLHAQLGVEVRERLVHQEHLRVAHERAAERHPLLLAARELARLAVQQRLELDRRRRAAHPRVDLVLRRLAPPEREREVVVDRHLRVQRVVLEDHRDVALARGDAIDHPLADPDLALGDRLEPGRHPPRGRVAG